MHIADGILPVEISIAANVVTLGLVYIGGRKLEPEEVPKMGVFAAALFIVSLIHIPIPGSPTPVHLGLYGFAGMLFGMRAIPIIFVNLLFQTLIFQHGGLLSLGVNTLTMGGGALVSAAIWRWVVFNRQVKSVICGSLGIIIPALLVVFFLAFKYGKFLGLILLINLPAAAIEGALTIFVFNFFNKVKPEYFK
jgi:cobalt/nickel transport system permease protein